MVNYNKSKVQENTMKKRLHAMVLAGSLFVSAGVAASDGDMSLLEMGISAFARSIGDYYGVPEREIVVIERRIPRDELGVVYLLANRSHQNPGVIADLRQGGMSWWDITQRLGLDPNTLYVVDSRRHSGPPYGKAYGYYKEGKKHRLRDDEIVELANTRFLSKYHGVSVDDVIDRRRNGEHYSNIDDHYRSKKGKAKQPAQSKEKNPGNKERGGPGDKSNKGNDR